MDPILNCYKSDIKCCKRSAQLHVVNCTECDYTFTVKFSNAFWSTVKNQHWLSSFYLLASGRVSSRGSTNNENTEEKKTKPNQKISSLMSFQKAKAKQETKKNQLPLCCPPPSTLNSVQTSWLKQIRITEQVNKIKTTKQNSSYCRFPP